MALNSSSVPAPGQSINDFCTEFRAQRPSPWDQPGYDAEDDLCNQYGYFPSNTMAIIFLILFSVFTGIHFLQTVLAPWIPSIGGKGFGHTPIRYPLLAVTAGGALEILGWASRVWSSNLPDERTPFIIQTTVLIIGPSFYSAAIYTLFGWFILAIEQPTPGVQSAPKSHSLLKPTWYVGVFVIGDIVSLVLQGLGGGIAATADQGDKTQSDLGTHIMEAGIVFQLVVTLIFAGVSYFFFRSVSRTWNQSQSNNYSLEKGLGSLVLTAEGRPIVPLPAAWRDPVFFAGLGIFLETAMIVLRGIYRTVELAQGWTGFLISHENFLLLDAIPMALCMLFFFVFHPHWTLPSHAGLGPKAQASKEPQDIEKSTTAPIRDSTTTLTSPSAQRGRDAARPPIGERLGSGETITEW